MIQKDIVNLTEQELWAELGKIREQLDVTNQNLQIIRNAIARKQQEIKAPKEVK
jgi:hypothetical protein